MGDSWSHSMNKDDNHRQSDLENNYINHLASYLGKLCGAKLMVTDRVEQLKQYIEALRRTNETTNKHYAQSFNIDDQLEQYKNHITIDEATSMSITADIYMNIEKAQKAVSPDFFGKFINHIQQHETGKMVDLSKYLNMNKMNNMMNTHMNQMNRGGMNMNRQPRRNMNVNRNINMNSNNMNNSNNVNVVRQRPLRNRHTRQSIATQTNLQRQQQQQLLLQQQQQQMRNNL